MEKRGRKRVLRWVSAGAFCLVFALLLSLASTALRGRGLSGFYRERRDSLDVLFLGSSHMLNGVSPMELWESDGIASRNLSENGQVLPVTYYVLMDALARQSPKLVVLDIYKVIQDTLYDAKSYLHTTLDAMPLGAAKLRAVYDFLPSGERTEFLFDIVLYHSRWKELGSLQRTDRDPDLKGWDPLTTVERHEGFRVLPESATAEPPEVAVRYLKKIVDLCRERDVELLFIATPFTTPIPDDMERQERVNAVAALAEEWGVPFVNMMHRLEEMDFDLSADLADMYHANVSGMKKITAFLGAYIREHYRIPDRRGDSRYAAWAGTWERYVQKLENL